MAGKRQHYVPLFLQRGFLADEPGEAQRTWLHWRSQAPKTAAIRDIGVGLHFYSKSSTDGSPTLDDYITEAESEFVTSLETLKAMSPGVRVDSEVASRLVMHLTFRTAHIRSSLTLGAMQVLEQVTQYICTNERMREALGVDGGTRDGTVENLMDQVLLLAPIAMRDAPPELAKRIVTFFVREQFDTLYERTMPELSATIATIGQGIPEAIQGAHKKVLATADMSPRERELATLSWQTVAVTGAVLPDCIAIARESNGDYVPLLLSNWSEVGCVILPIAHDRLLVGTKDNGKIPSLSAINPASASCSESFFLSKHPSHGESLSPLIGQRLIKRISAHVSDAIAERQAETNTLPSNQGNEALERPRSFSFSLLCQGFGDDEIARALGRIVTGVVQEVGRDMPLSRLHGITFAHDYESALAQLDRGDAPLAQEMSRPRDYGRAVAKCVRVVHDGQSKEHIVADVLIARMLLDGSSEAHNEAIHLLVNMLAHVAHTVLFEERLKGVAIQLPEGVLGPLHPYVSAAPGMYYAARQSAFALPDAGLRFQTLTLESLHSARQSIDAIKTNCNGGGDVDRLLAVANPAVASVLEHAAQWLGHRDGLPVQEAFPGALLIENLKAPGLDGWIELLGRDLRRIYATEDQFSADNIFGLGRHVERLLWAFRIFPWPLSDGEMFVTFFNDPVEAS